MKNGRVVGQKLDLSPQSRQDPEAGLVDPGPRFAEVLRGLAWFYVAEPRCVKRLPRLFVEICAPAVQAAAKMCELNSSCQAAST